MGISSEYAMTNLREAVEELARSVTAEVDIDQFVAIVKNLIGAAAHVDVSKLMAAFDVVNVVAHQHGFAASLKNSEPQPQPINTELLKSDPDYENRLKLYVFECPGKLRE